MSGHPQQHMQNHIKGCPGAAGATYPGPQGVRAGAQATGRMRDVLLTMLLALASVPRFQAVWLGRLDPKQVQPHCRCQHMPGAHWSQGPGPPVRPHRLWAPLPQTSMGCGGRAGPHEGPLGSQVRRTLSCSCPLQLLGSWYVLAVASGEKDFAVEKATNNIEGVMVTLGLPGPGEWVWPGSQGGLPRQARLWSQAPQAESRWPGPEATQNLHKACPAPCPALLVGLHPWTPGLEGIRVGLASALQARGQLGGGSCQWGGASSSCSRAAIRGGHASAPNSHWPRK